MSELRNKGKHLIEQNAWLIIFMLAVPFLNESFPTTPFFYGFFMADFYKFLSFGVLIVYFIYKRKKASPLLISAILLEVMILVSSLLNQEIFGAYEYGKMCADIASVISMGLVIECFLDRPDDLIKGLMLNMELAIYSYFFDFTLNLSGENYYRRGLLATLLLWILPGICIALTYAYRKRKYARSSILIVVSLYIIYKVWNATAIVALSAMAFVLLVSLLLKRFEKTKGFKIPLSLLIVAAILLNLFVLFIYTGNNYPIVSFIIEKILHKTTSFTERDVIWAEAIRMIKESPIYGHGSRPVLAVANNYASEYSHSHNQLLQKMNESGIIGLAIFAWMHIVLILKTDRSRNGFIRSVYVAAMFGISMTYITEAYKKFFIFYLVFFLAYHCDVFAERGKEEKKAERSSGGKRIDWIDMAKGYGILLTVYAHLGHTLISSWIYSFHMPLFFFISGYLFKENMSFKDFFVKKFRSLIVPYFGLGLPLIFAHALNHRVHSLAGVKDLLTQLLFQRRFLTIWFLTCLFVLNLIFYLIRKYVRNDKGLIIVSLISVILGYLNSRYAKIVLPWNVDVCLMALPFFTAGHLFRKKDRIADAVKQGNSVRYMFLCLFINIAGWLVTRMILDSGMDMFASKYGDIVLTYLTAFAGILFVLFLSVQFTFSPIRYIGENSILYLAWHQSMAIPFIGAFLDPTRYLVSPAFDRVFSFEILGGMNIHRLYYMSVTCLLIWLCNEFIRNSELKPILGK